MLRRLGPDPALWMDAPVITPVPEDHFDKLPASDPDVKQKWCVGECDFGDVGQACGRTIARPLSP